MRPKFLICAAIPTLLILALGGSIACAQGTGTGTGTGTIGAASGQGLSRDAFSDTNSSSTFSTDSGAGASSAPGQASNRSGGGMGAFGGGGANFFSQLFGGQAAVGSSGRRTLRALLRAEFDVVRPQATQVANLLSNRLTNIGSLRNLSTPIQVEIVDRVATLRGEVNSEQQKDLAERITRLEPGVSSVVNQLVVTPK